MVLTIINNGNNFSTTSRRKATIELVYSADILLQKIVYLLRMPKYETSLG